MEDRYRELLSTAKNDSFHWTPSKIALSVFLFLAAGLCEIGGGWLVWHALRGGLVPPPQKWWQSPKAPLYAAAGSVTLVGYGCAALFLLSPLPFTARTDSVSPSVPSHPQPQFRLSSSVSSNNLPPLYRVCTWVDISLLSCRLLKIQNFSLHQNLLCHAGSCQHYNRRQHLGGCMPCTVGSSLC